MEPTVFFLSLFSKDAKSEKREYRDGWGMPPPPHL